MNIPQRHRPRVARDPLGGPRVGGGGVLLVPGGARARPQAGGTGGAMLPTAAGPAVPSRRDGVVVQACLNGVRPAGVHARLPLSPDQLGEDARAVAGLGVDSVHVHPRGRWGEETIETALVGETVAAIHSAAPGVEVVVPCPREVEPDPRRRVAFAREWGRLAPPARPDTLALHVHEPGWLDLCAALHAAGIGIELGVWTPADAVPLHRGGLPVGVVRVVAEVTMAHPSLALAQAAQLLHALDPLQVTVLLHGEDTAAWPVWAYAIQQGLHTRIGLEDTLTHPDGSPARGNADLVEHALRIQSRTQHAAMPEVSPPRPARSRGCLHADTAPLH